MMKKIGNNSIIGFGMESYSCLKLRWYAIIRVSVFTGIVSNTLNNVQTVYTCTYIVHVHCVFSVFVIFCVCVCWCDYLNRVLVEAMYKSKKLRFPPLIQLISIWYVLYHHCEGCCNCYHKFRHHSLIRLMSVCVWLCFRVCVCVCVCVRVCARGYVNLVSSVFCVCSPLLSIIQEMLRSEYHASSDKNSTAVYKNIS